MGRNRVVVEYQVLVVEDEPDSMEMLQGILEYHGIRSVGASTAEEALNILEDFQPNLIVMDLALPGMDGWTLLQQLRAAGQSGVRYVAVTAYHSANVAAEAIEAGFDAYFSKPIDPPTFVDELLSILQS